MTTSAREVRSPSKKEGGDSSAQIQRAVNLPGLIQRVQAAPQTLTPRDVNTLQRTIGNQATARLLRPMLQTKLQLGPAGDKYERQADQVADQVVRSMPSRPPVQRQGMEEEEMIQGKRLPDAQPAISGSMLARSITPVQRTAVTFQKPHPIPAPVQRLNASPSAKIQRFSFKEWRQKRKEKKALKKAGTESPVQETAPQEQPVITGPEQTPANPIPAHLLKAQAGELLSAGGQAKNRAEQLAANQTQSVDMSDRDVAQTRETKGMKSRIKQGQRADAAGANMADSIRKELATKYGELQHLHGQVSLYAHFAQQESQTNSDKAYALGVQCEQMVEQMEGIVAQIQSRADSMQKEISLASAKARMMDAKEFSTGEKTFDWSSVELSASDAAMALEQNRVKIETYLSFLRADHQRVSDHVAKKALLLKDKEWAGMNVVREALASGMARGRQAGDRGKAKPLSDSFARQLLTLGTQMDGSGEHHAKAGYDLGQQYAGGEEGQAQQPEVQGKGNKYLDPSLRQGKGAGAKKALAGVPSGVGEMISGGVDAVTHPFSKNFYEKTIKRGSKGRQEIRHLRLIQGLELMALFQTQGELRISKAEQYLLNTQEKYEAALNNYDTIDQRKSQLEESRLDDSSGLDTAIINTGQAWKDVTDTTVYRSTLKQYKLQILEESKQYEKFGERAMVATGRKIRTAVAGILGSAVLGTLTGGLYRIEKTSVGGGYDVEFEGKSFIDDFMVAAQDYAKLAGTANGQPIRGLGGQRGAKAYGILQIIAKALGLLKSLSVTLGLFIPPAAPIFGSIALYAAIVKAALELVLMIWAGIGAAKTNDPRSRAFLKGKIAEHGFQFGGEAATVATAGILAGISGNTGNFTGQKGPSLFGESPTASNPVGEQGKFSHLIDDKWSQNIGGQELYYGSTLRTVANVASKQPMTIANAIGTAIGEGVNDDNVRNMKKNQSDANEKAKQKMGAVNNKVSKGVGIALRWIGGGPKGGHSKRMAKRLAKIEPNLRLVQQATSQMNEQVQGI